MREQINNWFDGIANPTIGRFSAFHVCGTLGYIAACVVMLTLAGQVGVSAETVLLTIAWGMIICFALAMGTKIVSGREVLIYYHHEIAVLVMVAIVLWLFDRPILPVLDLVVLGLGAFLAFGRVGCFMVGCCHGNPHRWGVCYHSEHVEAGFTWHYEGIRLLPVQLVESLLVLLVVLVGMGMVVAGAEAGSILAWYSVVYGIGRFALEFLRGDPARPYWRGFSEGQWTSVVLITLLIIGEILGLLPYQLWHVIAALGLILFMVAVTFQRKQQPVAVHAWRNPHHVAEIATLLAGSEPTHLPRHVGVGCTSLGLQVSADTINSDGKTIQHYALSSQHGDLALETATIIGQIIVTLQRLVGRNEVVAGQNEVYHLLVHDGTSEVPPFGKVEPLSWERVS